MGALLEIAAVIMSRAEMRVQNSAQNISNMTTVGYKSRKVFSDLLPTDSVFTPAVAGLVTVTDYSAGGLIQTANPFDLCIDGPGFFALQGDGKMLYTRKGQFRRSDDGVLVTEAGLSVQSEQGGPVTLQPGEFQITSDGLLMQGGELVAKLAVVDFTDIRLLTDVGDSAFSSPDSNVVTVERPNIRQGVLEASNVSSAAEMVAMMEALRQAETGQRIVGVYDDLLGRALTAFGQA